MRSRAAPFIVALLVLAGVTAACFWPLVCHPRHILVGPQAGGQNDLTRYFIPSRNFPRICRERFGQWPFWNPYSCAGMPHLGNPQAGLFYPPNWLCWWFDARDVLSGLLVLHHGFAGLGAYLLGRRYGLGWPGAVTGGVVFLASPYLMAHTGEGHYAQVCVVAWLPWAFLAFESFRAGSGTGVLAMAAVLALCFFAGHAQEVFYLVLILSAFVGVDLVKRLMTAQGRGCVWLVSSWVALGVGTAALVAVELIPNWQFTQQMVRAGGLDAAEAGSIHLSALNLLQLLNPFALGGPDTYRGSEPPHLYWETLCSFGSVPLVFAAIGVCTAWRRYPVARIVWLSLGALGFAFGSAGPVFPALYHLVPGIGFFRAPSRVLFFASLSVAILAAVGIDTLYMTVRNQADSTRRLSRWIFAAGVASGLLVLALGRIPSLSGWELAGQRLALQSPSHSGQAPGVSGAEEQGVIHRAWQRTFSSRTTLVWLLSPFALSYVVLRWPSRWRLTVPALPLLCAVQLAHYATRLVDTIPHGALAVEDVGMPEPAAQPGQFRVLARQDCLSDQQAWESGIEKPQGYDPASLSRFVLFFAALTGESDVRAEVHGFSVLDLSQVRPQLLNLLNVRYALRSFEPPPQLGWTHRSQSDESSGAVNVHLGAEECSLFENPAALPRAFLVGHARRLHHDQDLVRALAQLDPVEQVLLEVDDVLPEGDRMPFTPARVIEYTPSRVLVEAELTAPGYLVLSDSYYSGWTARDNGQPAPLLCANGAFRAVPLLAGSHRVEFLYFPVGLRAGAIASGLCWLLLTSLMVGAAQIPASVLID